MSIKVQGQVVITNDKKGQFEQVNPGSYTTAERDALTPAIGDIVFNSEADELQVWDGTEWGSTGSASGLIQPQVEVLTPLDRAGDPELTYLKSDAILAVEDVAGSLTYETDTISTVTPISGFTDGGSVSGTVNVGTLETAVRDILNGEVGTQAYTSLNGQASFVINFPPGVTWSQDIAVYTVFNEYNDNAGNMSINGVNVTLQLPFGMVPARTSLNAALGATGTLTNLTVNMNVYRGPSIVAFELDGEILFLPWEPSTLAFPTSNNFDKFAVGDMAQGWNYSTRSGYTGDATAAFDGDLTTATTVESKLTVNRTFEDVSTLRVRFGITRGQTFTINGSVVTPTNWAGNEDGTRDTWFTFGNLPSTIREFTVESQAGSGNNIQAIEINGEILVDSEEFLITAIDAAATPDPTITVGGGEWSGSDGSGDAGWNQSQEWSNLWSLDTGSYGGGTTQDLHNGTDTEAIAPSTPGATMSATFSIAGSVILTMGAESSGNGEITIDIGDGNGAVDVTPAAGTANVDSAVFVSTGSFTVTCQRLAVNGTAYLRMIRVDGKLLVDQGIAGAPDTEVSKTIDYDTKLTLAGDTDLSLMALGPAVMTDGVLGGSGYSQTPYTLTTPTIDDVTVVTTTVDWSSSYGSFGLTNLENILDGNADSACNAGSGRASAVTYTFTFNPPISYNTSLRVKASLGNVSSYNTMQQVNGVVFASGATGVDFHDCTTEAGGSLSTLSIEIASSNSGNNYPLLYAIEADGGLVTVTKTILSFPGDISTNPDLRYFEAGDIIANNSINRSEVWSDSTSYAGVIYSGPMSLFFDGDLVTNIVGRPHDFDLLFDPPLPALDPNLPVNLRIYQESGSAGSLITVTTDTGSSTSFTPSGYLNPDWIEVSGLTGGVTRIRCTGGNSGGTIQYYGIEINGQLMVDSGVAATDDAVVVSTDLATNTMVVDGGVWGTYDDSQVWSADVTNENASYPASYAFDNKYASYYYQPVSGVQSRVTFPTAVPFTSSVKVDGASNNEQVVVVTDSGGPGGAARDVIVTGLPTAGRADSPVDVTSQLVSPIVGIGVNGRGAFYSIEIDGKELVDAVEDSQVWSNYGTGTPYASHSNWDAAFNGVITTDSDLAAFAAGGQTMTWTPPTPLPVNTELIVYLSANSVNNCLINGAPIKTAAGSYGTPVSYTAAELGGQLTSIALITDSPTPTGAYLTAVRVDGELLTDPGVRNLGARQAATTIPGGTGDLVEIDAAANAVYLSAGDRAWIPTNNFNGETFAMAAGSLGNPPAPDYLDIAFTSMNAGTTPFTGVSANLSSRTWTLETGPAKEGPWTLVDTYEEFDMLASQDGATPWTTGKPVLTQSTWYRVKVTYNSTAAESVESDYHVFKTAI